MPPYFPAQALLVQVSGVAEILLGGMLMFERWRRLAGWGIIALLLAIFPANVHMALHPELFPQFTKAMLMIRLPIQGILIAWAYGFTRPGA